MAEVEIVWFHFLCFSHRSKKEHARFVNHFFFLVETRENKEEGGKGEQERAESKTTTEKKSLAGATESIERAADRASIESRLPGSQLSRSIDTPTLIA